MTDMPIVPTPAAVFRIGLVVNPVAGLGGSVGLRGSDGADTVAEAMRRGATAQAGPRTVRALAQLAKAYPGASLVVAQGPLGAEWAAGLGLTLEIARMAAPTGRAEDTRAAIAAMGAVDLVVFSGGDGTARDVLASLPAGAAMLGIPCGVKMHSGVFAISPERAGHLLADLLANPGRIVWTPDAEVMDIDEEALRAGHIAPRLYGIARVPQARVHMQAAKGSPRRNAAASLAAAADEIARSMANGVLYMVGPGTSAGAVSRRLGHEPTLLGVDAFRNGTLVARDATAQDLIRLAGDEPVRLVLGVTGQQGFVLGRGNAQITPSLIRRAGLAGMHILATDEKLVALAVPTLWVDTGDADLDGELTGFVRVQTDAGRYTMMRIGRS